MQVNKEEILNLVKIYIINVSTVLTLLLNVLLGGDPYQSFSGRVGQAAMDKKFWALYLMEPVINLIFYREVDGYGKRNHCRNSV